MPFAPFVASDRRTFGAFWRDFRFTDLTLRPELTRTVLVEAEEETLLVVRHLLLVAMHLFLVA